MEMYCKNCGELLVFEDGQKTTVCELCGMEQTLPKIDDPKKIELLVKANEYRMASRFDVAKKQYESIIAQYPDDNEAYWCKLLCVYGIEYVDDFVTARKIPTCHRTVRESIFNNTDYKLIISRASIEEKAIYETEAKEIDRLQKEIIEKANKEQPYDIFICFKDSDENGRRTTDSQYANKIYTHFTRLGYKVFFSPVTLKSRAGEEYEPIIYSALYTAKVMLFVCANKEYVSAPWVRNEWSRFLEFMREDYTKVLLPCLKDVYPYDLPEELSKIQVMDITDIDFYESLTRQIDSKFGRVNTVTSTRIEQNVTQSAQIVDGKQKTIHNYLERINIFLDDNDWQRVNEYAEKILDEDPKNARAYLVKTFFDFKVKSVVQLLEKPNFESNLNYIKVIKFADGELKTQLDEAVKQKETARLDAIYNTVREELSNAKTEQDFESVAELLGKIKTYKDSASLLRKCDEGKENIRKDEVYEQAKQKAVGENVDDYKTAIRLYESIPNWRDSKAQIGYCNKRIEELKVIEAQRKQFQQTISQLNSLPSQSEIDGKIQSVQEKLDVLNKEKAELDDFAEKFPELLKSIGDLKKEQERHKKLAADYRYQRSKLGFFEIKRKKECDSNIAFHESEDTKVGWKIYYKEKEKNGYKSLDELNKVIKDKQKEINSLEKEIQRYSGTKTKESIISLLKQDPVGEKMYEEYLLVEEFNAANYEGNKELTSIKIPYGITVIKEKCFKNCTNLASVEIPSSVTTIEGYAFESCSALTDITIPNSVTKIGVSAFYRCSALSGIEIPTSVKDIGACAFSGCTKMTDVKLPYGMKSIVERMFYGCSGLVNIEIPKSVTSIGVAAFDVCRALTGIVIPESVTSIESSAFYDSGIKNIKIPANVKNIGKNAFSVCKNLVSIDVDEHNPNYKSENGNLYSKNGNDLIQYALGKTDAYFCIPKSVRKVETNAFAYAKNLTSIDIPSSVEYIESYAFEYAENLTSMFIPSAIRVENCAFYGCAKLSKIDMPRVTKIGGSAFYGCVKLSQVNMPCITEIGERAFERCKWLISLSLPSTLRRIENKAFWECDGLSSIRLPSGLVKIGDQAFHDCVRIKSINIPRSVTDMGSNVFQRCENLTVYCEASYQPYSWNTSWITYSQKSINVIWGSR